MRSFRLSKGRGDLWALLLLVAMLVAEFLDPSAGMILKSAMMIVVVGAPISALIIHEDWLDGSSAMVAAILGVSQIAVAMNAGIRGYFSPVCALPLFAGALWMVAAGVAWSKQS